MMAFNSYMPQQMYGQYNPLSPYQQRYDQMQQMQQMQQQYPQNSQQFQNQQPMSVKGWAVASEEDAQKAMIDLDGSVFIFPDVQNGRVYSKQINTADFSPIFRTYQLVDTKERKAVAPDMTGYVSRQDFDQTVQSLKEEIERLSTTNSKKSAKEADTK